MTRKEFINFFGEDLKDLVINSVLNADIYNKMDKDSVKEFIINDVNERAKKSIHKRWDDEVNVFCHYTVIDTMYNIVDRVDCELTYTHVLGSSIKGIVFNSIT